MKRLWVQLTLAFGLVTLVGVLVVALLANRQVSGDFRQFLAQSQLQGSPLITELAEYYGAHGDWAGVAEVFGTLPGGAGAGRGMRRGAPTVVLADMSGQVVYDGAGNQLTRLAAQDLDAAVPIRWQDRTVGYLLMRGGPGQSELPMAAQHYLAQVNVALLQAGLLAGGLGVVLGVVIARGLAAPLGRLAAAARQMAQGKLEARVPIAGATEVADVARAFNEMAMSLQAAEQLRRSMVADIAHELRTPLTVIQGNLRAILDDVYALDKAEVATIYDETVMLSRLVGDLRELAQAEAGQLNLVPQPTDVAPLVEAAMGPFAAQAAAQQVVLSVDVPRDLPPMQTDPDRVRQVLHNLLANALRYTPAGGSITLSATLETKAESQKLKADGNAAASFVVVEVRDTGAGIAAGDLPHVFDRFWRADRARSRDQGGSGLGLAIARQLVEAQGGQIGVESAPGHGSRFWFRMPAAAVTVLSSAHHMKSFSL
jgi:two-component system OmpR family sensor kinase/two-component system sensor histidine kinase BaeS